MSTKAAHACQGLKYGYIKKKKNQKHGLFSSEPGTSRFVGTIDFVLFVLLRVCAFTQDQTILSARNQDWNLIKRQSLSAKIEYNMNVVNYFICVFGQTIWLLIYKYNTIIYSLTRIVYEWLIIIIIVKTFMLNIIMDKYVLLSW